MSVIICEHIMGHACVPAGKELLQSYPEMASKSGTDLLTALAIGTEMRKAWEGGSGGSSRLLQCLVNQGHACIAYSHGWMRKPVQHTILRSALCNRKMVCLFPL